MRLQSAFILLLLIGTTLARAEIFVNGPTIDWAVVQYPGVTSDWPTDQQANAPDLEIVGDATHPAIYTQFDDAETSDPADGEIAFRLRVSGAKKTTEYAGYAWIGVDVDIDGALDIFLIASKNTIGIYDAGSDTNTSPNTTSVSKTPDWSTPSTSLNFGWVPVSLTTDPAVTNTDVDNAGGTDYFVSFKVPFAQFVSNVLALTPLTVFDDTSTLSYVAATSTQDNALNSDLNGVNGDINSAITWTDLGALSPESGVDGVPVPEPATAALWMSLALLMGMAWRRTGKLSRNQK